MSIGLYSCNHLNKNYRATPYKIVQPEFFPKVLNLPQGNSLTEEGIRLGKYLFYDGRLSGSEHADSLKSCASCHNQSNGFASRGLFPNTTKMCIDSTDEKGYPTNFQTRSSLPLSNLVFNTNGYFWNGFIHPENCSKAKIERLDYRTIESTVWISLVSSDCMQGSIDRIVQQISSIPEYQSLFKSAYGTREVTIERINEAIGQFVLSITSYHFKFYDFFKGNTTLSPLELSGYKLFYSEEAGCFHCHAGSLLMTTNQYFNNAKDSVPNDPYDRYFVSRNAMDRGAYRVPSLINCELTAPYMHDGRFETLDEVIDFYSDGLVNSEYADPLVKGLEKGGIHLDKEQKNSLRAFLLTLTDHDLVVDPSLSCPEDLGAFGIK